MVLPITKDLLAPIVYDLISPIIKDSNESVPKQHNTQNRETSNVLPKEEVGISAESTPNIDVQQSHVVCRKAFEDNPNLPIARVIPAKETVAENKLNESQKSRLTPYEIAQILLGHVSFRIIGNALYVFEKTNYVLLDNSAALRLILQYCRAAARDYGDGQIIKKIYDLIIMEPKIEKKQVIISDKFVTFRNAVVNIETGIAEPPSPRFFDTAFLNVYYLRGANQCPNFDTFLHTLSNGNESLEVRIWEMIGYLLSNDISAKVFFVLQGVRNSGKSKLGEFIMSLFNEEAVTSIDINTLSRQFGMSEIVGKRLNASLDLPAGILKNESVSMIKQLTGGDMMTADIKFLPRIKFKNRCKLLFATNHRILLSERDDAFFDRLVVIPFTVSIPREQFDIQLLNRFENEKSAIVNNALAHYRLLKAHNYLFAGNFEINAIYATQCPTQNSEVIFDAEEQIRAFVSQCCKIVDESEGRTLTVHLFDAYRQFCGDAIYGLSLAQFSEWLKKLYDGFLFPDRWRENSTNPQRGFRGIILKSCADVPLCQGAN